ncbi:MAG: GGDEF domain-containing protein [Polyangiaceae bacterium]
MPELKRGEAGFLRSCVQRFVEAFEAEVADVLRRELGGVEPAPVRELRNELAVLARQLEMKATRVRVHPAHAPLVARVLVDGRRKAAAASEGPLSKVIDPETVKALRRQLVPYQELLRATWLADVKPARVPRITDFLSIHFAEQAGAAGPPLDARVYDEKFHILEAPALALRDLAYYRRRCGIREASLGLCYADIDDFKAVNTQWGEAVVDVRILPRFMEILESWAFARGHAYRFGGDEYLLLLPNADRELCLTLLGDLMAKVESSELVRGLRLRLSVGLCVVEPECFLTDREILVCANAAKQAAKLAGKNRIGVTLSPDHERSEVQ